VGGCRIAGPLSCAPAAPRAAAPKPAFNYTMSALATIDRLIELSPEVAAGAVRAAV
jgi:hypothetical protein